jgi:hypothetical protein
VVQVIKKSGSGRGHSQSAIRLTDRYEKPSVEPI